MAKSDEERLFGPRRGRLARYRARQAFRRVARGAKRPVGDARRSLVALATEPNHELAYEAREVITAYRHDPVWAALLGREWVRRRAPVLEALIRAPGPPPPTGSPEHTPLRLVLGHPPGVPWTPRHAAALVDALDDADARVREAARLEVLALGRTSGDEETLQALAVRWDEAPSGPVDATLATLGRIPRAPLGVRTRVALRLDDRVVLATLPKEGVRILLEAIRRVSLGGAATERARRSLRGLVDPVAREELCGLAANGDAEAGAAVRDAGFVPARPRDRAVLLFVTGQDERYADLDPEGRLLGEAYRVASSTRQDAIRTAARRSGRGDAVRLLLGDDRRRRSPGHLSAPETVHLVNALAEQERHDELWWLARELSVGAALDAAQLLVEAGWRPADAAEADLLRRMAATPSAAQMSVDIDRDVPVAAVVEAGSPPAVATALTPDGQHLAVLTDKKQVQMWRLADRAKIWSRPLPGAAPQIVALDVDHVVVYTAPGPDGVLTLLEPGGTTRFGWLHTRVRGLWRHGSGAVLALTDDRLLTCPVDNGPIETVATLAPTEDVRAVAVDDETDRVALALTDGRVRVVDLTRKRVVVDENPGSPITGGMVFAPGGRELLVGHDPIGILEVRTDRVRFRGRWRPHGGGPTHRRFVHSIPDRGMVLVVEWRGPWGHSQTVRAYSWPQRELVGKTVLDTPFDPVPPGAASRGDVVLTEPSAGAGPSVLSVAGAVTRLMVRRPLADTTPQAVTDLAAVLERGLPAPTLARVELLADLLRLRFRDDIEIEEGPPSTPPSYRDIGVEEPGAS